MLAVSQRECQRAAGACGIHNGCMDAAELRELLTPAGMRLLDEIGTIDAQSDVVRAVSRLRGAGHSPGLVAAVMEQARLRAKATAKFGDFAGRMLFTKDGLEQATRLRVASLHAGRFRDAGIDVVADLGCGIGADALAFAGIGLGVIAVERDEVTAAVASYNLAPFDSARVEQGDATEFDLAGVGGVWIDPARRSAAGRGRESERLDDPADWSPSLDWAFDVAHRLPAGIKLAPGLDRALIPDDVEAQWVSDGREAVELALWSGRLARDGVRRAALVIGAHGAAELTAEGDSADEAAADLGAYLLEPDAAVIRARLIGDLARRVHGRMIDPTIAWITADTAPTTPFGQAFRVIERYPLDIKTLKRALARRGIGTVEIKKRGVDIDPAQFRTQLAPTGPNAATLILTRVAGERAALLAERV